MNELLLLSGSDIPFPQGLLVIHPPTLKEISFIGEENLFTGASILNFSKDILDNAEELKQYSDFNIFLAFLKDKSTNPSSKISVNMVLGLLFPDYSITLEQDGIYLTKEGQSSPSFINNDNFEQFKEIIVEIFCIKRILDNKDYNPSGVLSQQIADQIKKGKQKIQQNRNEKQKISILSRYASILAVGLKKDLNSLMNYTVYQILDEYERFVLKEAYDIYIKAKMAGADKLEEVDNWQKDLYEPVVDDKNKLKTIRA